MLFSFQNGPFLWRLLLLNAILSFQPMDKPISIQSLHKKALWCCWQTANSSLKLAGELGPHFKDLQRCSLLRPTNSNSDPY